VKAATAGEVEFKVYAGGVLGEEKDVLFKTRVGQVDGGAFMGPGIGRICPDAQALMMPLLFDTYEEVDAVFPLMQPLIEAQCRANGFEPLGWTEIGFTYLYSRVPVRNLADLRAAKPWAAAGDEIVALLFKAGDVSAIPVQLQDVLPALQTGLIDTVYAPPLAAMALQWFSRVKYRNDLRVLYSFGGLFVAERAWKKVPEPFRGTVSEICKRRSRELTLEVRKSNDEAMAVMGRQGIEVLKSSPDDVAEFEAMSRKAGESAKGKLFSVEAYDLLRRHLGEYDASNKAP
jgi:TRAP-type C4-dicarboxylate transport system substrate-binding protein